MHSSQRKLTIHSERQMFVTYLQALCQYTPEGIKKIHAALHRDSRFPIVTKIWYSGAFVERSHENPADEYDDFRILESIQWLTTGWIIWIISSKRGRDFSVCQNVQTSYGPDQ